VRRVGLRICAALVAAIATLGFSGTAWAGDGNALGEVLDTTSQQGGFGPNLTYSPGGFPDTPDDYEIGALQTLRVADADPKVVERKASLGGGEKLTAAVTAEAVRVWEVGYFLAGEKVNLVVVDATSGEVTESWTGSAVDWPMARGHEGQFGHLLNAPWIWGPLAGIFLLGLWDFRRWRKWVHLDLVVLLSFGVSQAFFNAAEIGISVPLYYPPLLYLLARMLWLGFRGGDRGGTAGEGLRPTMPTALLAALAIGLIVLRIAANVADSGVIDVGYAGVIGADKITDSQPIYGESSFPDDNSTGDTYGPANYFAYVPFEAALPWSGSWDDLPAAHAAAIFFDLATVAGLFMLGRLLVRRREAGEGAREAGASAHGGGTWELGGGEGAAPGAGGRSSALASDGYPRDTADPASPRGSAGYPVDSRGYQSEEIPPAPPAPAAGGRLARLRPRLPARTPENAAGVTLAFAWVAYPYSAFALQSNSNDSLIAALLVWSLVAFASPLARGGLLAAASLAKFAPLALVPLYAAGERGLRLRVPEARHALLRPLLLFTAAFLAGAVLLLAHPAVDPGLADFYDRTLRSQLERVSPFSIWGQADLEWLHTVLKAAAVALAVLVAFVPRERSLAQVAALGAAVIIAAQLTVEHWFYLYIPWFLPMLLAALLMGRRAGAEHAPTRREEEFREMLPQPFPSPRP